MENLANTYDENLVKTYTEEVIRGLTRKHQPRQSWFLFTTGVFKELITEEPDSKAWRVAHLESLAKKKLPKLLREQQEAGLTIEDATVILERIICGIELMKIDGGTISPKGCQGVDLRQINELAKTVEGLLLKGYIHRYDEWPLSATLGPLMPSPGMNRKQRRNKKFGR